MTFYDLADECWQDLSVVRRWIAGRSAVTRILADAVLEFEPDEAATSGYGERLLGRVRRRNDVGDGEGFAILAFLLVTIAAAVISWLIQRWLDNHFPKSDLEAWQEELAP